jgi:hypothetical protein
MRVTRSYATMREVRTTELKFGHEEWRTGLQMGCRNRHQACLGPELRGRSRYSSVPVAVGRFKNGALPVAGRVRSRRSRSGRANASYRGVFRRGYNPETAQQDIMGW